MNTVISGLYAAEPEPLGLGPSAGIHDHESREQYNLGLVSPRKDSEEP
jgi:hypothetical protein